MLKFMHLFNFGVVGALVVPAALQDSSGAGQLERAIVATEHSIQALGQVEAQIAAGEYSAVDAILGATEAPFGGARERSTLVDQLRRDIGELENQVQQLEIPDGLEHLTQDPTQGLVMTTTPQGAPGVATTGLSQAERDEVAEIWPPIPGIDGTGNVRKKGETFTFEKQGFSVDPIRQGRAYYRASRYKEALRLFETGAGEPEADYWTGRALERLGRTEEAIAAYTLVVDNEEAGALIERARMDRDFALWLIDFERKVEDHESNRGGNR